jgi:deoxyadenosine/deoxycytidine kinase
MYRIGICGAHGTGKTTLGNILKEELKISFLNRTMRTMWEKYGIEDFEKLPGDIRTTFQKYAILKQIEIEEQASATGFITDRTVLDNLGYTILSSDMAEIDKKIYTALVKEHLKTYTHFIYLPVLFDVEAEKLRANIETRRIWDELIQQKMQELLPPQKYLIVDVVDIEKRVEIVLDYINQI